MTHSIPATSFSTLGVDIGDRKSHICILNEAGEVSGEQVVATTQASFAAIAKQHGPRTS